MNSRIFSEVGASNYCYQNNPIKETKSYKNVCVWSKRNPISEQKYLLFLVKSFCFEGFNWLLSANFNYPIKENSLIQQLFIGHLLCAKFCSRHWGTSTEKPCPMEFTSLKGGAGYDMIYDMIYGRYDIIWYMIYEWYNMI